MSYCVCSYIHTLQRVSGSITWSTSWIISGANSLTNVVHCKRKKHSNNNIIEAKLIRGGPPPCNYTFTALPHSWQHLASDHIHLPVHPQSASKNILEIMITSSQPYFVSCMHAYLVVLYKSLDKPKHKLTRRTVILQINWRIEISNLRWLDRQHTLSLPLIPSLPPSLTHTQLHTHTHTHIDIILYAHAHTHIHVYTHTHTHTGSPLSTTGMTKTFSWVLARQRWRAVHTSRGDTASSRSLMMSLPYVSTNSSHCQQKQQK